jgi:DNA-binding NarL/FixJ family response regulator
VSSEAETMTLRVALVDDHQRFRERLRALLERDPNIEIVAETGSGHELLEITPTTEFDVVCMDIRLPGMSGIETTRRLLEIKPGVRVIGLSAYAEPHYVEAMLGAGAVGQFTKGDAGDTLLHAIHHATVERPLFGANIMVPIAEHAAASPAADHPPPAAAEPSLGAREVDVLRLTARGLAPAAIARELSIEPTMLDVYRRNIMRKLQLRDDAALSEYARAWLQRHDGGDRTA